MNPVSYAMPLSDEDLSDASGAQQIEVTLAWGETALETRHLPLGAQLTVGEEAGCDLLIPAEVLGATRAVVVTHEAGAITVTPPASAVTTIDGHVIPKSRITLDEGRIALVRIGAFSIRAEIVRESKAIPAAIADSLRQAGIGGWGLSAVLHASLFASLALFMPALGATDAEDITRDQLLTMQRLMNASAEQEREATPGDEGANGTGEPAPESASAEGASGAMGKETAPVQRARWSAAGDAKPEDASLSHEQKLAMARDFGINGLLPTMIASDPNAPVVPWGATLNGADRESHLGNLWGGDAADAWGIGGLGISGNEEGGGGRANIIGVGNDPGGLGRQLGAHLGHCGPNENCGFGGHPGHVGGGHKVGVPRLIAADFRANGRLPAEVIQRIVRQNAGRFRNCYEAGLRTNPSLEGRVAVRFVIGRGGAVSLAQDGDSDMPDANVRACVIKTFYDISFPAPDNGTVTVTYPIAFSPAN